MQFLKLYLSSLFIFTVVDVIWLKIISNKFFTDKLSHLMSQEPKLAFAVVFYILYPLAIIYLVLDGSESFTGAMIKGGVLGATVYGTYELTNMTILKDWPAAIIVPDVIWGGLLTAAVSAIVYYFFV